LTRNTSIYIAGGEYSMPNPTRAQLVEIAECVLGRERAAALSERLTERARHLSLVASADLPGTDEPGFGLAGLTPGGDDRDH
jgi:hypothetical protein